MDRPALRHLLSDIESRRIDIVVVYKVDRLTRALTDFAKIIDAFDRHGVGFVSVTQQFSTTTSMGRLTLNMLLSFAQFEREVTGERIRDKIAASKKKGMWMGGFVPLGYDKNERTLTINEPEAETVRALFRLYLELACVRRLEAEADALGLVSKRRAEGRSPGGRSFTRGHLYRILSNPIYIGEIAHKGKTYPGQHSAIIERATWDAVQAQLAANQHGHRLRANAAEPSLLAGCLVDQDGERLTPSHANKRGRRYRYYVSRRLIEGDRNDAPAGLRVPAHKIEALVVDRVQRLLIDEARLFEVLELAGCKPAQAERVLAQARKAASGISERAERDRLIRALIERIVIGETELRIIISRSGLEAALQIVAARRAEDVAPFTIAVPMKMKRCGGASRLIIAGDGPPLQRAPDPALVRAIVRAHRWRTQLTTGQARGLSDIAEAEKITSSYVARVLRLAFLAPDIVEAILDGQQPPEHTADRLIRIGSLSLGWAEQRTALR
jgi:site-specific DNA recombinase